MDSKDSRVVGRFVFTNGTAPRIISQCCDGITREHTGILQQLNHGAILSVRLPRVTRKADGNVKSLHLNRVLQRHRNASQRALEVDLLLGPFLGLREQYLGYTVRLLVCLECHFPIRSQDIDGVCNLLVDILDELLDGLA